MLQIVNVNELDGALGTLPAGLKPLALVGPSTAGTVGVPAAFARTKDVVSTFGRGPLVEAAARWIGVYNRPCVLVRTGNSTAATLGTIDVTGKTGTSVVANGTSLPDDHYEPYIKIVTGGTIGVAGITYQWSLDNGRNLSAVTALGTANALTLEGYGAGTGTFLFGAGTLVAGDIVKRRDVAPSWNAAELGAGLSALSLSAQPWEIVQIVGAIDATAFDTIATAFAGSGILSERGWVGNTRMPNVGESEAAYLTAINTIFSAKANAYGMLCYGAQKLSSPVSYRQYRRPVSVSLGALQAYVSEEIDISAINVGNLPGVDIRDALGNPDEHDESINPGADDARFATLRTIDGVAGVYCTNPRVFSAVGSDFEFMQHRRVMNLAKAALRLYFMRRLSVPIEVDPETGFITDAERLEIESGANAILRSVLRAKPKVSSCSFTLNATDNLLSTKTLTGTAAIVPLAYPKVINLDLGFRNPALQIATA